MLIQALGELCLWFLTCLIAYIFSRFLFVPCSEIQNLHKYLCENKMYIHIYVYVNITHNNSYENIIYIYAKSKCGYIFIYICSMTIPSFLLTKHSIISKLAVTLSNISRDIRVKNGSNFAGQWNFGPWEFGDGNLWADLLLLWSIHRISHQICMCFAMPCCVVVILSFVNSLGPGRSEWNFRYVICKLISVIDGWGSFGEIALRWTSLYLGDDNSTLVQVMAWCHHATSHYVNQCWPRSLTAYGVTRPQWVKLIYLYYSWYLCHIIWLTVH